MGVERRICTVPRPESEVKNPARASRKRGDEDDPSVPDDATPSHAANLRCLNDSLSRPPPSTTNPVAARHRTKNN